MRILILHNNYRIAGGEESVVRSEADLLKSKGHVVAELFRHNLEIDNYSFSQKAKLSVEAAWSRRSYEKVQSVVRDFQADIVHVHNTHLLWSPSVFAAAREAGAATVMTLHNFRVTCLNAVLFRDGQDCTECVDHGIWRGVVHRCYENSLAGSAAMARVIHINRSRGTWKDEVDAFIAMTKNGRTVFVQAGLPENRIHLKPNFIKDPLEGRAVAESGRGALFIGHLIPIKGIQILMEAWRRIDYPLRVVGTGSLSTSLRASAPSNVEFTEPLSLPKILDLISDSSFVLFPSVCRETFSRVIVETFAMGRPVIASRHGSMAEIIRHGQTGLLYEPFSVDDLRDKVLSLASDPELAKALGRAARLDYLDHYTADVNYARLMEIYQSALNNRHGCGVSRLPTARVACEGSV